MYHEIMNYKYAIFAIALAGTSFSGFLSGVKFFSDTCALGETCPRFFGQPACYYGFGLFLTIFILSVILVFKKTDTRRVSLAIAVVSIAGIAFAGKFVIGEILQWAETGFEWSALGLPTCAYGLIFYALAYACVMKYRKGIRSKGEIVS